MNTHTKNPKQMCPEISIVVPVYKTERFLRKCLDSILRQTFTEWELIAVDDASPDRSNEILAGYQVRDPRVRVIVHPINRGLSHTRFTGLASARGRYVVFVDSDDWIPPRALELLHQRIEAEQADVVIGGMTKVLDGLGIFRTRARNVAAGANRTESIDVPELFEKYFINYFGVNLLPCNVCGRIYRRSTLRDAPLEPTGHFLFEDMVFNLQLHPYLTRVGFVPRNVYYYRFGGGTSTSTPRFLAAVKDQYRLKERYIDAYEYRRAEPYIRVELINCFFSHFANLMLLDGMDRRAVEDLVARELDDPIYGPGLFEGIALSDRAQAMRDRDTAAIMRLVEREVRRNRLRHSVKRTIFRMIK